VTGPNLRCYTSSHVNSENGLGLEDRYRYLVLPTMASDLPTSRKRALLKRSSKAIGDRLHTFLPISRSSSLQPLALPDANTTNLLLEPLEVEGNQYRNSILPNSDPPALHSPAHTRINPAHTVNELGIVKTSRPRGDQPSTSDQPFKNSSSTRPGNNYSDRLVTAGSVAWKGLETALRLLEKSADACPPLKSAVCGLVACLNLTQVGYCFDFVLFTISEVHLRQSSGIMKSTRNWRQNSQPWQTRWLHMYRSSSQAT